MKVNLVDVVAIIGLSLMIKVTLAEEENVLCHIAATKRMLETLGISSTTKCLLQKKKDMKSLVHSYLEKKQRDRQDDLLEELSDYLDHEKVKRGRYCCSPDCDPFMARLGYPTADVLRCVP